MLDILVSFPAIAPKTMDMDGQTNPGMDYANKPQWKLILCQWKSLYVLCSYEPGRQKVVSWHGALKCPSFFLSYGFVILLLSFVTLLFHFVILSYSILILIQMLVILFYRFFILRYEFVQFSYRNVILSYSFEWWKNSNRKVRNRNGELRYDEGDWKHADFLKMYCRKIQ